MRPRFLDRPRLWTTAPRRDPDPIRDAYAIERPMRTPVRDVLLACAIGIALAAACVYGWPA